MKTHLSQLLLVLSLGFSTNLNATDYYTLSDGSWSDVTTVWSTDGVTPCGCAPTCTSDGAHNIYISHNISLDCNLDFRNSLVQVSSSGSIDGPTFRMILRYNSTFYTEGQVNLQRLTVTLGTTFTAVNTKITCTDLASISGILNLDGSWMETLAGNFTILDSGELNMTNCSQIKAVGNFQNFGITNICTCCCIESTGGNIFNGSSTNPIGVINGDGALYSSSGNLNNYSTVDMAINWCVSGSSTGMPMADNCAGTITICTASPLYKSNVELSLSKQSQKSVLVSWTKSDRDVKFYYIERSVDNESWNRIYSVAGNSASIIQFTDYNPLNGDNYYRIVEEINNEEFYFSDSKYIFIENGKITLYPNPSNQSQAIFLVSDDNNEVTFTLFDIAGRMVHSSHIKLNKGQNEIKLPVEISPAHYVVNIASEGSITSIPFVVIP